MGMNHSQQEFSKQLMRFQDFSNRQGVLSDNPE